MNENKTNAKTGLAKTDSGDNVQKKEVYRYLPSMLVLELEKLFEIENIRYNTTKDNFIKAIARVYRKSFENTDIHSFAWFSSSYWKKIYGGNYYKVLKPLLDQKILQRVKQPVFNEATGETRDQYHYRINPDLMVN